MASHRLFLLTAQRRRLLLLRAKGPFPKPYAGTPTAFHAPPAVALHGIGNGYGNGTGRPTPPPISRSRTEAPAPTAQYRRLGFSTSHGSANDDGEGEVSNAEAKDTEEEGKEQEKAVVAEHEERPGALGMPAPRNYEDEELEKSLVLEMKVFRQLLISFL